MASKLWRLTKFAVLPFLAFLVVLAVCASTFRAYHCHQIARATAIDATRGIDETLFVKIGGIDQWISIRGQDRTNPVLPLLHRGPGLPTSPYPRNTLFDWTRDSPSSSGISAAWGKPTGNPARSPWT